MNAQPSPVTAFVLAGGGSFGAVQVGMLRALITQGVRLDLVVGVSVGALNGAYFAGRPGDVGVAELERLWRSLRRQDVFPVTLRSLFGLLFRRDHVADPRGVLRLLEAHLPYARLEEAAIPLHIIATDLFERSAVRLSEGTLCDALMASAAIPAVFPPVRVRDRTLIDGGIASNTPIRSAVELNASRLIVPPTGFACALAGPPRGIIATALHALNLLIARQLVM